MSKTKSAKDNWKRFATKRRWSEAEARAVVDAWRASGQRVQKFAREQGVGAWRLRYWVPRLDPRVTARTTSRQSSTTAEVRFVPAVLSGTASGNRPAVVIRLPDGIAVELHDAAHAGALEVGQLVAQLRGVAS